MSHIAVIQNETKRLNQKVSKQVSKHTTRARKKLEQIADFEQDFDQVYSNFIDGKLPKDDLYWQIKQEMDDKTKISKKLASKNILPQVHANKFEELKSNIDKEAAALQIKEFQKNNGDIIGPDGKVIQQTEIPVNKELKMLTQIEEKKKAFEGDFSKVDDEIKAQIKALSQNDFKTILKLQNQEMSKAEIQYYIADVEQKLDIDADKKVEYDEDLNRTLYQEFWTDLKEFKPKVKNTGMQKRNDKNFSGRTASSVSYQKGDNINGFQSNRQSSVLQQGYFPSINQRTNFSIDIKDPNQALNVKIDEAFIKPRMKFDTIFEEYIEKQKQFNNQRSAVNKQTGDTIKQERDQLKTKIESLQKMQAIDLKHAKETALKNAQKMIDEKLQAAKFAYEEELEFICEQFEEMQREVQRLNDDKVKLKKKVVALEEEIIQLNSMIENTGHKLIDKDTEKSQQIEESLQEELSAFEEMTEKGEIKPDIMQIFKNGEAILKQEFSFYSFSLQLNQEQQDEIMAKTYNRYLQKQIVEMQESVSQIQNEINSTRKMTKEFRQNQEISNKKIIELQTKNEMINEQMNGKIEMYEKRINQMIRDFVKTFDKLSAKFKQYKVWATREIDVFDYILAGKDKIIEDYKNQLVEYKEAIRIPRQHFKNLERLRFEEMVQQKAEIIEKIRKRYGIDPTKPQQMIQMPDPSLPPEKQMEIAQMAGNLMFGKSKNASPTSQLTVQASTSGISMFKSPSNDGLLGPTLLNGVKTFNSFQRNFSIQSIMSRTTADTSKFKAVREQGNSSLVLQPSFRYGLHKNTSKN